MAADQDKTSAAGKRARSVAGDAVVNMLGPFAAAAVIALAMQFVFPSGGYSTRIALDIGVAVIAAVSLNIVNGWTGQFSIGHAGFMTLGGYAAGAITLYGSLILWGDNLRHGGLFGGYWLFVAACLVGGFIAAGAGYVVGLPSLRLRGDYLAIVTLGFGEIVRVLLQQTNKVIDDANALRAASAAELWPPPLGGSTGFYGVPKYTNLFWVYFFVTMTVVAAFRIKQSSLGRAMISIREDEVAAQAMGVNIARTKVLAFVLAAFFAGTAGGLMAHQSGLNLSPKDAGFQRSFEFLIMVVLGGRGSISGAMLAAAILTALPEVLREVEQYRLVVYALLLIVMMLLRPQGLFGIHEIWDYWTFRRRPKEVSPA
jgi:branched-chain amino acid transport system permease protein